VLDRAHARADDGKHLGATSGIAIASISLKSSRESTSNCIGVVATTVATRSAPSISAISPKKPPAPIVPTFLALDAGHGIALDHHEESLPGSPSRVTSVPDGIERGTANVAMRPISAAEQPLNSQTPCSSWTRDVEVVAEAHDRPRPLVTART